MTESNSTPPTTLPPGDTNTDVVYIAVGMAVHAWENMEQFLAQLWCKFQGLPADQVSSVRYGEENGTFSRRMTALANAAEKYFQTHPDQDAEGDFSSIWDAVNELAIERHRIAHGHLTMWVEFKIPEEKGLHTVTASPLFRWAPPFYGISKLRTDPVGLNSHAIAEIRAKFEAITVRAEALSARLP